MVPITPTVSLARSAGATVSVVGSAPSGPTQLSVAVLRGAASTTAYRGKRVEGGVAAVGIVKTSGTNSDVVRTFRYIDRLVYHATSSATSPGPTLAGAASAVAPSTSTGDE